MIPGFKSAFRRSFRRGYTKALALAEELLAMAGWLRGTFWGWVEDDHW